VAVSAQARKALSAWGARATFVGSESERSSTPWPNLATWSHAASVDAQAGGGLCHEERARQTRRPGTCSQQQRHTRRQRRRASRGGGGLNVTHMKMRVCEWGLFEALRVRVRK
jgi:hypothetical protein